MHPFWYLQNRLQADLGCFEERCPERLVYIGGPDPPQSVGDGNIGAGTRA